MNIFLCDQYEGIDDFDLEEKEEDSEKIRSGSLLP